MFNILDVVIVLILASGMAMGFKRGFFSQLVSSVGMIVTVVLAFILKNPVSVLMYTYLPFFKFAGVIRGVTVLNIALYEIMAFLFVLGILTTAFQCLIHFTNIFEGLLKVTIVLAPISKIGGMIVGFFESYIWVFLILYTLSLPMFDLAIFDGSKLKPAVLNNTPVLSGFVDKSLKVLDEFKDIKAKYETTDKTSEFNRETLDLFLKYDVITVESVDTLVKNDKLKVDNIESVLKKYRD